MKDHIIRKMRRCLSNIEDIELARWFYKAKVERIIDGDTLDVDIDLGFGVRFKTRVRLAGINAPEKNTLEGKKATRRVEELIKKSNREVYLRTFKGSDYIDEKGKYGRWLALVLIPEGVNRYMILNEVLLEEGLAEPYDPSRVLNKCDWSQLLF